MTFICDSSLGQQLIYKTEQVSGEWLLESSRGRKGPKDREKQMADWWSQGDFPYKAQGISFYINSTRRFLLFFWFREADQIWSSVWLHDKQLQFWFDLACCGLTLCVCVCVFHNKSCKHILLLKSKHCVCDVMSRKWPLWDSAVGFPLAKLTDLEE